MDGQSHSLGSGKQLVPATLSSTRSLALGHATFKHRVGVFGSLSGGRPIAHGHGATASWVVMEVGYLQSVKSRTKECPHSKAI